MKDAKTSQADASQDTVCLTTIFGEKPRGGLKEKVERHERVGWRKKLVWWLARRSVSAEIDAALDWPLDEELASAFQPEAGQDPAHRYIELYESLAATAGEARDMWQALQAATPESPLELPLGVKLTVEIGLKHEIDVRLFGRSLATVELQASLALRVEDASLALAKGRLHSVSLGQCDLNGSALTVSLEGLEIFKAEPQQATQSLGTIRFSEPIDVAEAAERARLSIPDRRRRARRREDERRKEDRRCKEEPFEIERRVAQRRKRRRGGDRRKKDRRIAETSRRRSPERRAPWFGEDELGGDAA